MGRTDVTLDLVVNGLVVRASEQVSDYLWVPNTGESTVSKWDAGLQREVARYRVGLFAGECPGSCCYTAGCNQVSRLVVDGFGNAYAANRGFSMQGTITKIAPDRAHCVDRNMNGVIDTSTGPMDLRPYGGDECVLWTAPVGQFDAVLRSITIDRGDALHPEGYPWIGGCVRTGALDGNAGLWQLNPLTGATLRHVPFEPCAYGAVTTPDGTIWEHTLSVGISPINPRTGRVGALIRTAEGLANTGGSYGITTDADGRIWLSRPSRDAVGYDPTTRQWARVDLMGLGPRAGSLGITVDPRNHVWVAGTNVAYEWSARAFRPGDIDPAQVTRHDFDNVGNLMAVSAIGADRRGRIWMASARPGPLVMLDPLTDRAEAFAGPNQVYTYSDFTGAVRRLTIGSGHYDELYNTDCDAQYDSFSWSADLPTGTSIQFVLRTALTEAGLVDATAVPIAVAPVDRPAVDVAARLLAAGVNPGQFARISATFNTTNDPVQSPILRSIQFSWRCR
jgi:streptogramin lyase